MTPDTTDTIVAVASARGPSRRGVVRLSGPDAAKIVSSLTGEPLTAVRPIRLADQTLRIELDGAGRPLPADLAVWPDTRSYTHQPSVEIHTVGSPVVLDAVVRAGVAAGARPAERGEFTLRAFLAGRLDLTQAEAVLAVIDAEGDAQLATALERLAGGLSTPLHRLRAELLALLADLEAGLDFVEEEDVRFVEPAELRRRLTEGARLVAATQRQLTTRSTARPPRAALVGPPNVGKSRLFNALRERYGEGESESAGALVADQPGVTRDALAATLRSGGLRFELVDTAGDDEHAAAVDELDAAARDRLDTVRATADLLIACRPAGQTSEPPEETLPVATMADRGGATADGWLATSAATGEGLEELAATITERLRKSASAADTADHAAERSRESLATAHDALARAADAAEIDAGEELVSLELREALDALGRVVGEVDAEEVLGQVFAKFCIGK